MKGYITCHALSVGDYGGAGSTGEGNIRALEETEGAYVKHGPHGFRQLYLPDTEENREIVRALEEDYPVFDEEAVSEVEAEWEQEAWENWLENDLALGIEKAGEHYIDLWDGLEETDKWRLYGEAQARAGVCPHSEHSGMYVDVRRLVTVMPPILLEEALSRVDELVKGSQWEGYRANHGWAPVLADWLIDEGEEVLSSFVRAM